MNVTRLASLRGEHPAWLIERAQGRRTIGYTATRRADPSVAISAVNLTELGNRLRVIDGAAAAPEREGAGSVEGHR